ncbi:MAG TPA: hypothetical protein VFB72_02855, partial [Verrucomicrobiae bacterium]|nr:hypothetical protein [Verrucomicrobiae bacterium]
MEPSLPRGRELMRPPKRSYKSNTGNSAGAALLCFLGAAGAAKAQDVVMSSPPTYSVTPAAVQAQLGESIASNPLMPGPSDLLHWGSVTLRPHAAYQVLYGTGLLSAPGQQHDSFVQTLSPGVLVNIGSHWTLDYTANLTYYSNDHFQNAVNHSASLNWGTYYEDWSFGFSQSVGISDTPLIQTAAQTETQTYTTALTAGYRFNTLMSMDVSLSQAITTAPEQYNNSDSWNAMGWLNYQFFPRLDGGIGIGYGYDKVSLGPNMENQNAQVRVTWHVANKIDLVVHGGVEDVEYIGGGVPNTVSPIYGASLQYRPFAQTSISLSADRSVTPSLFASQATKGSSLSVALNQRLLKHFSLGVSGSYVTSDYIASLASAEAGRSDSYYSIGASLGW